MRAVAELQRIDEEGSVNNYDCRTCRIQGLNVEARACLLDRTRYVSIGTTVADVKDNKIVREFTPEGPYIVTTENYAELAPEEGFLTDERGREVCFVPHLIVSGVNELCTRELDAKEYGLRPKHQREVHLYREVRGLRNQHEREAMKRRMPKGNG